MKRMSASVFLATLSDSVRWFARIATAGAVALGLSTAALAQQEPEKNGEFGDWSVWIDQHNGAKHCFAATEPIETRRSQEVKVRGRPFLIVSTFLSENIRDEVSVTLGFEADSNKTLEITIDDTATYRLFAEGAHAFIDDQNDSDPLVTSMRRGGQAEVTSVSKSRGTVITDVYSLKGVTAALRRVAEVCK